MNAGILLKLQIMRAIYRYGHTVTAIDENRAVLFGGENQNDGILADLFVFTLDNKKWVEICLQNQPIQATVLLPHSYHSTFCINISEKGPHLLALGGYYRSITMEIAQTSLLLGLMNNTCATIDMSGVSDVLSGKNSVSAVFVGGSCLRIIQFGGILKSKSSPLHMLKWSAEVPEKIVRIRYDESFFAREQGELSQRAPHNFNRNQLHFSPSDFIGAGRFGEVYEGRLRRNGQPVAVKVFVKGRTPDREKVLLRKEAKILALIGSHPNIVSIIGVCRSIHLYAIVMEFVNGGDLAQLLKSSCPEVQKFEGRIHIAYQIAAGMNHLHSNSPPVIHNDLTSKNVLVNIKKNSKYPFTCKICDFGLSRTTLVSSRSQSERSASVGAIGYIAPELFLNETAVSSKDKPEDTKLDVYNYGVLLWEIKEMIKPSMGMGQLRHDLSYNPLPKGEVVAPKFYSELIVDCTLFDPSERPDFNGIVDCFDFPDLETEEKITGKNLDVERVSVDASLPFEDSTRKPADKNEKVLKVLSLCDEWGSSKGGLSTFNRFFCKEGLAMAKIEGYDRVEVRCRVNDYDSCDCDVKLTSEKAPVYAKEFKPDLVISHSTVTGDKGLEVQKECGEMTKRVHFVHTWPRDLERVKEQPDGAIKADKKVKREQAFIEGAAAVAAVGPYLAEKWHSELAPVKSNDGPGDKFPKVFDVTPGLICPVDKNQIQRETKGILCLGRLTDGEVKGVDIVVKAAASFRKKEKGSSDGKVEFVFRGIPEDEVAETERKLCQETGISQKRTGNDSETIDVKPYATPDEIRGDYDRASVVVMPSSAEGFGLVALEALSRGTPVIVSKGCGFAKAIIKAAHEHLSPEDSDWLEKWIFKIERGTEEDIQKSGETLMKKIESVLSNSSSYEHARKLKTAYEKTFTWKKSAENLLKAIF
eukprot:m.208960 g.208960  ORF g.208960 m.208960 type:complete len:925 (+) comp39723_c0_seq2:472-3246(+)